MATSYRDPRVVFRINKLKSEGKINAAMAHNARTRETLNADPTRENVVVKPCDQDAYGAVIKVLEGQKIRSNAVLAVEVVISASPEYFRPNHVERAGYYDEMLLVKWRDAVENWIKEKFPHAVSVILHLDEATPHYQVIDVPLDERGKLNARGKYGGDKRGDISRWQDWAAESVAHLGIKRGIKGSQATHINLKNYYARVNSPTPSVSSALKNIDEVQVPRVFSRGKNALIDFAKSERNLVIESITPVLKSISDKANTYDLALKQKKEYENTVSSHSKELEVLKTRFDNYEGIPFAEVLRTVYFAEPIKYSGVLKNEYLWRLPDGREVKTVRNGNGLITCFVCGTEVGSSLELVMSIDSLEYMAATALLSETFPIRRVASELTLYSYINAEEMVKDSVENESIEPLPSAKAWPELKKILDVDYGIPSTLLEELHNCSMVYADKWGHAVFPRIDGGSVVCEFSDRRLVRLVGKKEFGGPYVIEGDGAIWICDNPIDAISIKAYTADAMVIALVGKLNERCHEMIRPGRKIILFLEKSRIDETEINDFFSKSAEVTIANLPNGQKWKDVLSLGLPLIEHEMVNDDHNAEEVVVKKSNGLKNMKP